MLLALFALVAGRAGGRRQPGAGAGLAADVPVRHGFPALFFETNTAVVLLFVLGGCWVEIAAPARRRRARGAAGRRARRPQVSAGGDSARLERRLANVVQEMALASGHRGRPRPGCCRATTRSTPSPPAGAPDDAVVAVTRGALERLTRAELQGLVAHEFSHLVQRRHAPEHAPDRPRLGPADDLGPGRVAVGPRRARPARRRRARSAWA